MSDLIEQKQGFSLRPQNMQQAMELANIISNSDMVPKDFKGKPGNTLVAMMLGSELGLNPTQALQNIAVINGKPALYGDSMLALVQNHAKYVSIKETFDENTMTATCLLIRKGDEPHTVRFSKADAEMAGLWGKAGPWKQYAKRMLQMRARGFALRDKFADALSGLISVEEARDYNVVDITENASHETVEPESNTPPDYPDDKFKKNLPNIEKQIQDGLKTVQDAIDWMSATGAPTESQIKQLNEIKKVAA